MRICVIIAAISVLWASVTAQPWPWPTANPGSVHPINNNYGEYQKFGEKVYCHPGVDIVMNPGDGIYTVADTGFVSKIFRPDSARARCTDEEYFTAIKWQYPPERRVGWDGGEEARRFFAIYTRSIDRNTRFCFGHYEPWSLSVDIARAYLNPNVKYYHHGSHEKLAEVVDFGDNDHLHYGIRDLTEFNTSHDLNDIKRMNPVKCLTPDPALPPPGGMEFDEDEDKRVTFRYAEDEGVQAAQYFGLISVPEGGEDVEYRHVWGNADAITRCWDKYQLTPENRELAPYEIGLVLSKTDVHTGNPITLVDYTPLVIFDGNVADDQGGIWYMIDNSEQYTNVIYENDNTNPSAGGPPQEPEFSFILTNQDGSLDADGRPVIALSDANYFWDTDGYDQDAWNDINENEDHEALCQPDALFPDQGYWLKAVAKDHLARAASESTRVLLDNFAPYVKKVVVKIHKTGGGEIEIYEAEWDDTDLVLTTREDAKPIQNDTLWVEIFFSEAMRDQGIEVKLLGGHKIDEYELTQESLESEEYENDHWTGRVGCTVWNGLRNLLAGKLFISIEARDKANHRLDCAPHSPARRRNQEGEWAGYEDENMNTGDSGGTDKKIHWFDLDPFTDLAMLGDCSGSVYNYWSGGAINTLHHTLDFMIAEHDSSGRNDTYRASLHRYWQTQVDDVPVVELVVDMTSDLEYVQEQLMFLYGMGAANFCSNQSGPMSQVQDYLIASSSAPRRLLWLSDGQTTSGPLPETQMTIWEQACADTTGGTTTRLYLVTQAETAEVSDAMAGIIHNSGGACFSVPHAQLGDDPPVSEVLYGLIRDDTLRYQIEEESPTMRQSYPFDVDPLMSSIIVLGAWIDWGMQLAPYEQWCSFSEGRGDTSCCGEEEKAPAGTLNEKQRLPMREDTGTSHAAPKETNKNTVPAGGGARNTFRLYDSGSVEIAPTGYLGDMVYWIVEVDSSDAGQWELTVSGGSPFRARVASQSSVRLDLLGSRGLTAGATDTVKVHVVGTTLTSPDWALIGPDGTVYDESMELYDDGAHGDENPGDNIWGNAYTFPDSGVYRVLARWQEDSYDRERSTAAAIKVYSLPSFVFLEPDGVADTTGSNFVIKWEDESDLSTIITLCYDDNNSGADGDTIATDIREDSLVDTLRWNVFGLDEGDYYLYAILDDGLNTPSVVYSVHQVSITAGHLDGWPTFATDKFRASPVAVDLEANGSTLEVIGCAEDSMVYIWRSSGDLLSGYPLKLAGPINATPAVGNIDTTDQELEILVGTRDASGTVCCLNPDGSAVSGWPITLGSPIESAPTLADLDGNGELECIVACGNKLHVYRNDGTPLSGWPQTLGFANSLFTSPCVADFDGDGTLEIAVGGGSDVLYLFDATGALEWQKTLMGNFLWSPLSSCDLDWDGLPDILVHMWSVSGSRLYAFKGDGTDPAGWSSASPIQVGAQVRSGASPGDITGDGRLELVVSGGNGGFLFGFASDGTPLPGAWSSGIHIAAYVYSPVCVADLDGNGSCEVIVLGIDNDKMNVLDSNGTIQESLSRALDGACYGAPCIADIDLDGDVEILAGTDAGTMYCFDFGGSYSPLRMEYPKFQGSLANDGLYREVVPPAVPTVEDIEVVNSDELKLSWSTVVSDTLSRDELVTTYRIYRGTDAYFHVGTGSLIGSVSRPETTFVDATTGIVGDGSTNYSYAVTALDQHGNESQASNRFGEHDFTSSGRGRGGERDRKQLRPRSR